MGDKLILDGWNIKITVSGASLIVLNGIRSDRPTPEKTILNPKQIKINSILLFGETGYISLEALKWLALEKIQVDVFKWDGSLISSFNQEKGTIGKRRIGQYQTYLNEGRRLKIAQEIIKGKLEGERNVLSLIQYPEVNPNVLIPFIEAVDKTKSISELMGMEGEAALTYWNEYKKGFPEKMGFNQRSGKGATDIINTLLNYGYSLLEADCLRFIGVVGLDPSIGFLHEMRNEKRSLAYDLQEPFRGEIDVFIWELMIKSKRMKRKDFLRMDNYFLRLWREGSKKISNAYEIHMSERIEYGEKLIPRRKVIERKVFELAEYVEGRREDINFLYQ